MLEIDKRKARSLSLLGPSGAVGTAAVELAERNSQVLMLTSDLCFFSGLERFRSTYPDKLVNVGIAEQNMVGVAAGFAKEGFIPYVGTYASFVSRCADQIRVNMSYMKLPIKFIGLSGGYATGILGATHMSIEDISFMRAIPGIDIISPADCIETVKALVAVSETGRPAYIRLTGTIPTPIVYSQDYSFEIGKAITIMEGSDVCLVASGSMVYYSIQAAKLLMDVGITASVIDMHTIKPLDKETLDEASKKYRLLVVLEEHSIYGGLYSAVAEYLSQKEKHVPLRAVGIEDFFVKAGSYQYQMKESKMTTDSIVSKVQSWLEEIG